MLEWPYDVLENGDREGNDGEEISERDVSLSAWVVYRYSWGPVSGG